MGKSIRKKEKLNFKEWWNNLRGRCYVVNHNTKEIHRLSHKHSQCKLHLMTNREFVTKKEAQNWIETYKYNGCRFCWEEEDEG